MNLIHQQWVSEIWNWKHEAKIKYSNKNIKAVFEENHKTVINKSGN
jgi:hypothetical protein